MEYIVYRDLYKTMTFESKNGKRFKYEIFKSSDASKLLTSVSLLDEFLPGLKAWVVIEPALTLPLEHHHPEYATEECVKHFRENYFSE
ncbi:hypothetical protein [Siccibacter turicensis]|uniref:hypothetical protein n=1 Tax=Siccibacter turicensis TaxID=357233 RepID=UPI002A69C41E|nr:hypothetical protein [Siccibacter turicensis]MDY0970138.1 hypothetical protein [Siccibacter turicensis]